MLDLRCIFSKAHFGFWGIWIACLGIRLWEWNAPLLGDELASASLWGQMTFPDIIRNYQYPNNHIFNTLLISVLLKTFGPAPGILRLPVLIAGMASLIIMYRISLEVFTKRLWALIAVTLSGFSSWHIYYSTNSRGYILTLALGLGALWTIIYYLEQCRNAKPSPSSIQFYGIPSIVLFLILFLGTWSIPTFILFEGALLCILVFLRAIASSQVEKNMLLSLAAGVVLAIVACFWQYFILISGDMLKLAIQNAPDTPASSFLSAAAIIWMAPFEKLFYFFVLAAAIGLIRIFHQNRGFCFLLGGLLLLPIAAIYCGLALEVFHKTPLPRILFFLQPVFLILAVLGVESVEQTLGSKFHFKPALTTAGNRVVMLLFPALIFFSVQNLTTTAIPERSSREPWHELRDFIRHSGPNDLFLVSNRMHVAFLLNGAKAMRKRLMNIMKTGRLDNVYFLASYLNGRSDRREITKDGRSFYIFEDFIKMIHETGEKDLALPADFFKIAARFNNMTLYQIKPSLLKLKSSGNDFNNPDAWHIQGNSQTHFTEFDYENQMRPAVRFVGPFNLVGKTIQQGSGFALNLNFLALPNTESPTTFFIGGHLVGKDLKLHNTWVANAWTVDHPYGPDFFNYPWRPLIFITEGQNSSDVLLGEANPEGMRGLVWGMTSYRLGNS